MIALYALTAAFLEIGLVFLIYAASQWPGESMIDKEENSALIEFDKIIACEDEPRNYRELIAALVVKFVKLFDESPTSTVSGADLFGRAGGYI